MRLRIFSDIHLEFESWIPPRTQADVVIVAGDLHVRCRGISWLKEYFEGVPIVYIAGNHEFYGSEIQSEIRRLRDEAHDAGIYYLENQVAAIGGLAFLGCTLWTDFKLFGDPAIAGPFAAASMNDYRRIRTAPGYRRLKGLDTAAHHQVSRSWLAQSLAGCQVARTVVVTHHAPSARSVHPTLATNLLSAAYASDMDSMIAAFSPALWVHGHTHHSVDYRIGATRVIANQRGYPGQFETGFRPDLVVEI